MVNTNDMIEAAAIISAEPLKVSAPASRVSSSPSPSSSFSPWERPWLTRWFRAPSNSKNPGFKPEQWAEQQVAPQHLEQPTSLQSQSSQEHRTKVNWTETDHVAIHAFYGRMIWKFSNTLKNSLQLWQINWQNYVSPSQKLGFGMSSAYCASFRPDSGCYRITWKVLTSVVFLLLFLLLILLLCGRLLDDRPVFLAELGRTRVQYGYKIDI